MNIMTEINRCDCDSGCLCGMCRRRRHAAGGDTAEPRDRVLPGGRMGTPPPVKTRGCTATPTSGKMEGEAGATRPRRSKVPPRPTPSPAARRQALRQGTRRDQGAAGSRTGRGDRAGRLPGQRLINWASMGKPIKVTAEGRTFYICCDSCEDEVKTNAKDGRRQARQAESRQQVTWPAGVSKRARPPRRVVSPGPFALSRGCVLPPWKIGSSHAILFANV